jgi:hypothetical protein
MVPVTSLLVPILLAAVVVFVASSALHMMLSYHKKDFRALPAEDEVMAALGPMNIPPGDYVIPHATDSKEWQSEAFLEKANRGPVAFMTVVPNGPPKMGASLAQWFVYCLIVGLFAAYITGLALGPGADYMRVFRIASATAFTGYSLALLQNSIWYKRNWSATLKSMADGLLYALLTGGVFGWLWPV